MIFYVRFGAYEILEEKKLLEEKMRRLSNTVATKVDDSEEDIQIQNWKRSRTLESISLILQSISTTHHLYDSMIRAKTWTFTEYFCFRNVLCYIT